MSFKTEERWEDLSEVTDTFLDIDWDQVKDVAKDVTLVAADVMELGLEVLADEIAYACGPIGDGTKKSSRKRSKRKKRSNKRDLIKSKHKVKENKNYQEKATASAARKFGGGWESDFPFGTSADGYSQTSASTITTSLNELQGNTGTNTIFRPEPHKADELHGNLVRMEAVNYVNSSPRHAKQVLTTPPAVRKAALTNGVKKDLNALKEALERIASAKKNSPGSIATRPEDLANLTDALDRVMILQNQTQENEPSELTELKDTLSQLSSTHGVMGNSKKHSGQIKAVIERRPKAPSKLANGVINVEEGLTNMHIGSDSCPICVDALEEEMSAAEDRSSLVQVSRKWEARQLLEKLRFGTEELTSVSQGNDESKPEFIISSDREQKSKAAQRLLETTQKAKKLLAVAKESKDDNESSRSIVEEGRTSVAIIEVL